MAKHDNPNKEICYIENTYPSVSIKKNTIFVSIEVKDTN